VEPALNQPDAAPKSLVVIAPPPSSEAETAGKFTDIKMRLHQRLLDEINLSAIEKLSIEEFRDQVGQLVKEMMRAERVQFNQKEQDRSSRMSSTR